MVANPSVQTYLNLIPSPNNQQPKFTAWAQAATQIFVDQQVCVNELINAFNINTAIGAQLDIIGELVGVSRQLNFIPIGYSPILTDTLYQTILYAQILKNQWDGTISKVYSFWSQYLPNYPIAIIDNQDMTMTVWIAGMSGFQQQITAAGYYVPKPAGVGINYIFGNGPFFAWDTESTYLQGWDQAVWLTSP
jgi:hypothetical protein